MKKHLLLPVILLFLGPTLFAQGAMPGKKELKKIKPSEEFDNIHVQKLYGDEEVTSFLIWIKSSVTPHIHVEHSEHVYVLKGKAIMTLGESEFEVRKGDWIFIPKGTAHSVKSVSKGPLKVISIQAPEFDGSDRVYIKPKAE